MKHSYNIGEFSQITGLPVKTLRFYHEKGVLIPSSVDEATGYRYYAPEKIEKARIIKRLRQMEFSLEDIAEVLVECTDEADILNSLERQKVTLQQRIQQDRDIVRSLNAIIATEKIARRMLAEDQFAVVEKNVAPLLVAGRPMKGRYSDCGMAFAKIGKTIGRHISGKAMCLYYDDEYREEDANFEPCFPIRREVAADGLSIRTLPGGRCLTLVHRGPYDQLGRSYAKLLQAATGRPTKISRPTCEIYLKGPGMIFKGNPKNYLTEIQLPVERSL